MFHQSHMHLILGVAKTRARACEIAVETIQVLQCGNLRVHQNCANIGRNPFGQFYQGESHG